uniref:Uncharacterized protein n=1 Tax=Aegilops tauschii subsp. strangulata TaxID=200361 RepID=A0A453L449_AEGTS
PGSGPGRGHHGGPRQGRPLRRPGRHRHRQVRLQQAPSGSQRRRLRRGQVARLPVPRVQDRYPRRSFSSFCHLPLPSFKSFDSFRCRPPPKVQIPPPAPQHTVPVRLPDRDLTSRRPFLIDRLNLNLNNRLCVFLFLNFSL